MDSSPFRSIEISDRRYERDGLRHVTVGSTALRGRADVSLFVPAGLRREDPREPPFRDGRDPPLVILLHGVHGSHWAWASQGGAHLTARRLIRRGTIRAMVLAMPSDGLRGGGTGYLRHPERDFERWIVEEVPAAAALAAGRTGSWPAIFLAGLSMGGFGALRLGAKHAGRFRAVSGHSSITRFEQMREFVEDDLSLYHVRDRDRSVLRTILENRDRCPPLRFDCGTEDPLIEHNRELHRQLTEAGVPHRYREFRGGHEWPYWEDHVADSLRFFHEVLSDES